MKPVSRQMKELSLIGNLIHMRINALNANQLQNRIKRETSLLALNATKFSARYVSDIHQALSIPFSHVLVVARNSNKISIQVNLGYFFSYQSECFLWFH
eukprot:403375128